MANSKQPTYRVRRSLGFWYVKIYEGFGLDKFIEQHGPYSHAEAIDKAVSLDIADGDKGEELSNLRGNHAIR